MVTSARIPSVLVQPIAVVCALGGCYLMGSGLYDLFVDHDTNAIFTKGGTIPISRATDAERFHRMVSYRLGLGVMLFALSHVLYRLHHWWRTTE